MLEGLEKPHFKCGMTFRAALTRELVGDPLSEHELRFLYVPKGQDDTRLCPVQLGNQHNARVQNSS